MEPTEPTQTSDAPAASRSAHAVRIGLSGKLLLLTVLFVMVAEVLIYVPSIANFRLNWLNDRLAAAHTAALVLDAAPSGMVPESLAKQILDSVGARAVAMKMGEQRRLLAASNLPSTIDSDIDMRDVSLVARHKRRLRRSAVRRAEPYDPRRRPGADGGRSSSSRLSSMKRRCAGRC